MSVELEIAKRIYELDKEVFEQLHSKLGRVFTEEKNICIKQIVHNIKHRKIHIIRSETALILNMIYTVPKKKEKEKLLAEYKEIKKLIGELPKGLTSADILDKEVEEIKKYKEMQNQHLIICIGREFGSAGTEIAFELANRLNIEFYDKEIFDMVLQRLEMEKDSLSDAFMEDDKAKKRSFFHNFNKYHGLPREDAFFFNQSDLILKLAKEESFVIVGRCADAILTHSMIPHYNIFIEAPFPQRVKRTMEMKHMSYKDAVRFVKKKDRYSTKYYNVYTGKKWGNSTNYDLCINSGTYGVELTVDLIEGMIKQ